MGHARWLDRAPELASSRASRGDARGLAPPITIVPPLS
jgi:hypothetical protein